MGININMLASQSSDYKGWSIVRDESIQIGYKLPNLRSTLAQVGIGTHRKINGYVASHPEHYPSGKHFTTLKHAREYIDAF